MPRTIRDLVGAVLALAVLFGVLTLFNVRVREGVTGFGHQVTRSGSRPLVGPISEAAVAVVSVVRDFAGDNTFLFTFIVAGVVLVVLMLRS